MQDFLEANADFLAFYAVIGGLLVAVSLEVLIPRRGQGVAAAKRWLNNIGLTVFNHVFVYWVELAMAAGVAWFAFANELGFLNQSSLPFPVQLVITFLALELLSYAMHRVFHRIPMLWRVHRVHHTDTEVDFSTTFRSHPLEILILSVVSALLILLLGAPVAAVVLYQAVRIGVIILEHSNILVPERLDSVLRTFLVTPDFHRLHHSTERRFTDSNYGAMLSIYDHLLGTATCKSFDEVTEMKVGLDGFRSERELRFDRLLTLPFRNS